MSAPERASGVPPAEEAPSPPNGRYSAYVLGVLVLVYVLNFLDRQIITILAEDIKADLGMTDAEVGFLYGTAFAVFYAVFGIPLGRLADVWTRRSLISLGLAFWSAMTALSGMARNFGQLSAARIGVGVGESSATPAAFSMLSDSFPAAARATVLAIYSSGIYIGAGLGLLIGGQVVQRWNAAYPDGGPWDLVGWQAAYLAVGMPGLLLALWVRTLKEPVRGAVDGILTPREPRPFRQFGLELLSVLPPFTPWHLRRPGVDGGYLARNAAAAVAIAAVAGGLVALTGNALQWVSLGIGLYVSVCWIQSLWLRDRPAAALIFGTPSLRWVCLGFAMLAFSGYAFAGWTPSFFIRIHEQNAGQVGNVVGLTTAFAGLLGVTLGGALADVFRRRATAGRLYLAMGIAVLPIPLALWMLTTSNVTTAYVLNVPLTVFSAAWIGAGASTVQDLVLPRMRAIASAFYILVITFVGLALGPYTVGQLSDVLGDLSAALRFALVANFLAVLILLLARRHLARDEETLLDRARDAGEPGLG